MSCHSGKVSRPNECDKDDNDKEIESTGESRPSRVDMDRVINKMDIEELRNTLESRGLNTDGKKKDLITRLKSAISEARKTTSDCMNGPNTGIGLSQGLGQDLGLCKCTAMKREIELLVTLLEEKEKRLVVQEEVIEMMKQKLDMAREAEQSGRNVINEVMDRPGKMRSASNGLAGLAVSAQMAAPVGTAGSSDSSVVTQVETLVMAKVSGRPREQLIRPTYMDMVKKSNTNWYRKIEDLNEEKSVTIMPKPNQNQNNTTENILNKIKPHSIGVGISMVKNTYNGGLKIFCESAVELQILKNSIEENVGDEVEIVQADLTKTKNPKLMVFGVDEEDDHTIVNKIIKQNKLDASDTKFVLKINSRKQAKSYNEHKLLNIVLEVDPKTRLTLVEKGAVYCGWMKCKFIDYVYIVRCYKCNMHGHMARECKNNESCAYCAGNHKYNDCVADYKVCSNCSRANDKYNANLNTNHEATSKECKCYQNMVDREFNKINYNVHDD